MKHVVAFLYLLTFSSSYSIEGKIFDCKNKINESMSKLNSSFEHVKTYKPDQMSCGNQYLESRNTAEQMRLVTEAIKLQETFLNVKKYNCETYNLIKIASQLMENFTQNLQHETSSKIESMKSLREQLNEIINKDQPKYRVYRILSPRKY